MRECLGPSCPNIRSIGALAKKYRDVRFAYARRMEKICGITPEKIAQTIAGVVCSRCPECTPMHRKRCWELYREEAQKIMELIAQALMVQDTQEGD